MPDMIGPDTLIAAVIGQYLFLLKIAWDSGKTRAVLDGLDEWKKDLKGRVLSLEKRVYGPAGA